MPETKAYVADVWPQDAIAIQVRRGEGRTARIGVIERPTGLEGHAPILRMVPVTDLVDDGGAPRPNAPHPGIMLRVEDAEAVLVALLAWSESTDGHDLRRDLNDARADRDLALAEVADLRHELAVVEEQRNAWEVLAMAKDELIEAKRDHLGDVSQYAQRDARRLEFLETPRHITLGEPEPPKAPSGIIGSLDVRLPHQDDCGHTALIHDQEMACTRPQGHGPTGHHDGAAWWDDDGREIPPSPL